MVSLQEIATVVSTIFAFLALATHSSIQTNGFSSHFLLRNRLRKIPFVIHNRVSTSRLFAEEEGTAVEEPAVEEESSIEAAAEEAEDKTKEVGEAEKD